MNFLKIGIFISFISLVNSICPNGNIGEINNACLLNIIGEQTSFQGHDNIRISWDPNLFSGYEYYSKFNS